MPASDITNLIAEIGSGGALRDRRNVVSGQTALTNFNSRFVKRLGADYTVGTDEALAGVWIVATAAITVTLPVGVLGMKVRVSTRDISENVIIAGSSASTQLGRGAAANDITVTAGATADGSFVELVCVVGGTSDVWVVAHGPGSNPATGGVATYA